MRFQALPHKNLIVSALIALGAVLLVLYLTRGHELFFGEKALVVQPLPQVKAGTEDIDTDMDGLPDWKEKLYGSNINAVDSDSDGTNDGDEVRVGRNPAIPNTAKTGEAPNDKLSYLEDPNIATSSSDVAGIKKEFFAKYLAEGSQNIKETTFRSLVKKVDTKAFAPKEEIINLNISSDNSAESTKAYVNAFGVVIKKYLNQHMSRSEDMVLNDALTKKDASTRSELQLFAVAYKNFANDLLALQVPSALAKAHLLIVNGYDGMGQGLLGVGNIQSDPMNGAAGYEAYMKYRLDVIDGYAMTVAYIIDQHIVFAQSEPGYPFYWNTRASKTSGAK